MKPSGDQFCLLAISKDHIPLGHFGADEGPGTRLLAHHFGGADAFAGEAAAGQKAHCRGAGVAGGAGHGGGAGGLVVAVQEVQLLAHGLAVLFALNGHPHDGEILVALRHEPEGEEQGGGEVQGTDLRIAHTDLLLVEEAGFAEHPHLLDVAGVTEGLLLHVGDVGKALDEAPEAIRIEGFQGAQAREIQQLCLGERREDHHLAVLHVAGGAGVFLDDIDGTEARLVLVGPGADHGQATHQALEGADAVPLGGQVAEDDVVAAGRNAAVHNGRDLLCLGQGVQLETVLVEEGDVHQGLGGLQHGLGRGEAHEPRHGAHHEVCIGHGGLQGFGIGEVHRANGQAEARHAGQGRL